MYKGINLNFEQDIKDDEASFGLNTKNRNGVNEYHNYGIVYHDKVVKIDQRYYYGIQSQDYISKARNYNYKYSPKWDLYGYQNFDLNNNGHTWNYVGLRMPIVQVFVDTEKEKSSPNYAAGLDTIKQFDFNGEQIFDSRFSDSIATLFPEAIMHKNVEIGVSVSNAYTESGLNVIKIPDGILHFFLLINPFYDTFNISAEFLNIYVKYSDYTEFVLVRKIDLSKNHDEKITNNNDYFYWGGSGYIKKNGEPYSIQDNSFNVLFYSGLFGYQDENKADKTEFWFLSNKIASFSPIHNVINLETFFNSPNIETNELKEEVQSDLTVSAVPFFRYIASYGHKKYELFSGWWHYRTDVFFQNNIKNSYQETVKRYGTGDLERDDYPLLYALAKPSGSVATIKYKTTGLRQMGYSVYDIELYAQYVVNNEVYDVQIIKELPYSSTYIKIIDKKILKNYNIIKAQNNGNYNLIVNVFLRFNKNEDKWYRIASIDFDNLPDDGYIMDRGDNEEDIQPLGQRINGASIGQSGYQGVLEANPVEVLKIRDNDSGIDHGLAISIFLDGVYRNLDRLKIDNIPLNESPNYITDVNEIIYDTSDLYSDVYGRYINGIYKYNKIDWYAPYNAYVRWQEYFDTRLWYAISYDGKNYNTLAYSLSGYPECFKPTDFFKFDSNIVELIVIDNYLYVFTEKNIYVITRTVDKNVDGILETQYTMKLIFYEGAYEFTVKKYMNMIFFMNENGYYMILAPNDIRIISININKLFEDFEYYVSKDNVLFSEIKDDFYITELYTPIPFVDLYEIIPEKSNGDYFPDVYYTYIEDGMPKKELFKLAPSNLDIKYIAYDIKYGVWWFGNNYDKQVLKTKSFVNIFSRETGHYQKQLKRVSVRYSNEVGNESEFKDGLFFCYQFKNSKIPIYGFSFGEYYKSILYDKRVDYSYNNWLKNDREKYIEYKSSKTETHLYRPLTHTLKPYRTYDFSLMFVGGKKTKIKDFFIKERGR